MRHLLINSGKITAQKYIEHDLANSDILLKVMDSVPNAREKR